MFSFFVLLDCKVVGLYDMSDFGTPAAELAAGIQTFCIGIF